VRASVSADGAQLTITVDNLDGTAARIAVELM
jgi:hypothetical protein